MPKFEELTDEQKWNMARDQFSKLESRVISLTTIIAELQRDFKELKKKLDL